MNVKAKARKILKTTTGRLTRPKSQNPPSPVPLFMPTTTLQVHKNKYYTFFIDQSLHKFHILIIIESGRNNFPLQKQRSLDDYTHPSTTTPTPSAPTIIPDHRYLRTDLCAAILLSRCTFCDQSFELDDQLRTHLREKHWNYFFDNPTLSQEAACEALDLSMRKSPPEVTGSLPNLSVMQSFASTMAMFGMDSGGRGSKKVVKCATCGKAFSTKWNWKQHQKIHLRENLQACIQ